MPSFIELLASYESDEEGGDAKAMYEAFLEHKETEQPHIYRYLAEFAPTEDLFYEYLQKGADLHDPNCLYKLGCRIAQTDPELAKKCMEEAHQLSEELRPWIDLLRTHVLKLRY